MPTVEQEVRAEIKQERTRVQKILREIDKFEPKLLKEQTKASDATHRLALKTGPDKEPTKQEKEYAAKSAELMVRLRKLWHSRDLAKQKLAELEDPNLIARLVHEREARQARFDKLRERSGQRMANSKPRRTKKALADVPKSLTDRILKEVKDGVSTVQIAENLHNAKVDVPGGGKWDYKIVRRIVQLSGQSVSQIKGKPARKSSGSVSKASSKSAARRKAGSGNAKKTTARKKSSGGRQAKPYPKQEQGSVRRKRRARRRGRR
jgi:hypothetical protein